MSLIIHVIEHMHEKPHAEYALSILKRVARRVAPIMVRRGYKVGALCEFSHPEFIGLNQNHGEKIFLRLRSPQNDSVFLDFEETVGTMLHELAHNVHERHDGNFRALLEKHMEEYAILRVAVQRRRDELAAEAEHPRKDRGKERRTSTKPQDLVPKDARTVAAPEQFGFGAGVAAGPSRRQWDCMYCTFINAPSSMDCMVCGGRPY